jgi:hypothetical protein
MLGCESIQGNNMTLVAVWKFDGTRRIHAVADTRIKGDPGILTEHGPKILPLTMICKKPGPSGFYDREAFRAEFGFAYCGSTLSALSAHALANILCGNLAGHPEALIPSMDDIALAVGTISHDYMREICQLGGEGSMFGAVLFGHCPRTGQSLAFEYQPSTAGGFSLKIQKHVLGESDVVIIGSGTDILRKRIEAIRAEASHPIVVSDAPERALEGLINEGSIPNVGGAVQQAWSIPFRLEIAATMSPITPRPPSPRNVGLFVLGFDTFDMQNIGDFRVSLTGR